MRCAGYVICQDDDDLARRVLHIEPGEKRPRQRPRMRWEGGVKEDVAKLRCRNWTVIGINWEGWRKLLKEAEAHFGL
jgi:hypothetical protein